MLDVTTDQIRLFLHILAATVWIGGQITLGAVVPLLRPAGTDVVQASARRFRMIAWPAYGVLLLTGAWNLIDADLGSKSDMWVSTLSVKLWMVIISGAAAFSHQIVGAHASATTDPDQAKKLRMISGILAGLALLSAIAAAFFGVQLA